MRIRFATALTGLVLLVVGATAGTIGAASYLSARAVVHDLTGQLLAQYTKRIDQHLDHILDLAAAQAQLSESMVRTGQVSRDDPRALQRYYLEAIETQDGLTYLSFSTPGGDYLHVHRERDGSITAQDMRVKDDAVVLTDYQIEDGTFTPTLVLDDGGDYRDPTQRPFYVAAESAGEAVWTDSYVFLAKPGEVEVPGVTRAIPVFDGESLLGVVTADFDLLRLSEVLSSSPVGESGYAFVIELTDDGRRVLAHPNLEWLTRVTEGQTHELVPVDAFADPVVRTFADRIPDAPQSTVVVHEPFTVDGTVWLGGHQRITGDDRPDWVVGVVLPQSAVMGHIDQTLLRSALIGVVGLFTALLGAFLISRRLSGGLSLVEDELDRVSRLELSNSRLAEAPLQIAELHEMGRDIDAMKEGLRSFARYVPTPLVRRLLASGQDARLGAEPREITILFSDIEGFTTLVESNPGEVMLAALSHYLERMNEEIDGRDGTVCQYLGDAIMAFWGAPDDDPNHPVSACRAALAMKAAGEALAEAEAAAGRPALYTRYGLNTGTALVGNIGAPDRFNYVGLGDAVNTAARLEALNKVYSTRLLIGASTADRVRDALRVRPVDWVQVKGKEEPVMVYELIGELDQTEGLERAIGRYRTGLEHYRARRFSEAIRCFEEANGLFGGKDGPCAVLIDRARGYEASPPPDDWNGVHVMTRK